MNVTNIRPLRDYLSKVVRTLFDIHTVLVSGLRVTVTSASGVAVTSMPTTNVNVLSSSALLVTRDVTSDPLPSVNAAHHASIISQDRMSEV